MAKPTLQQVLAIENLCTSWHQAACRDYINKYGADPLTSFYDTTRFTTGKTMFHLVISGSSAFLVDILTGTVYGNKGWLKADRNKIIGNAYDPTFDAAALVRDRFRYGHFENNPDGSLRQPIVKR